MGCGHPDGATHATLLLPSTSMPDGATHTTLLLLYAAVPDGATHTTLLLLYAPVPDGATHSTAANYVSDAKCSMPHASVCLRETNQATSVPKIFHSAGVKYNSLNAMGFSVPHGKLSCGDPICG